MNKTANELGKFVLFSEEENRTLDERSFEKVVRGKPATCIACTVRNRDVRLTPEESTRQLWLSRLISQYGYPAARIAVEYPITFGRDSSKRADIVVFDADRPTVPYIIIEVKQGKLRDGKEQLRSYAHATGAPLAMWSNGILAEVWHRKNPNYFVSIHHLPHANQTIEDIVDQPWTIQTLIDKENEREHEGSKARSLRDLIVEMEDEVLANAGVDVFEEVFKLVFTKLYDEMSHRFEHGTVLHGRLSLSVYGWLSVSVYGRRVKHPGRAHQPQTAAPVKSTSRPVWSFTHRSSRSRQGLRARLRRRESGHPAVRA